MNDLIRRQDAIDALKICDSNDEGANCHICPLREKRWNGAWYDGETNCHEKLMRDSAKLLELPSEPQWIPVTKKLPEELICDDGYVEPSDYVLVWGDHGNYGVSRYWGSRKSKTENPNSYKDWMDLDWIMQEPIAWMPLPEPYKERSEENVGD